MTANGKKNACILMTRTYAKAMLPPDTLSALQSVCHVNDIDDLPEQLDEAWMTESLKNADICLTSWGTPAITERMIAAAPRLQLIAHCAGTVKRLVPEAAWERNIRVTSSSPIIATDVAETALGLIILSLKRFHILNSLVQQGVRDARGREQANLKRLYKIKLGIVGASHVGKHLLKLLQPFDIDIGLSDPYISEEQAAQLGVRKATLDELMAESDLVTLHAPILPETANMINRHNLALMKDGAILINTARGALIDTNALAEAAATRNITAYVDEVQLPPGTTHNPLLGLDNVFLTPGIAGGVTTNGRHEMGEFIVRQIQRYIAGSPLEYEVTKAMLHVIA
ncbi:MAG: putative oxidoreductase [Paenibacillus sp.]|jgi:phosphoglycerate dehydrogenase-like enzyme|nr:putative oxidoreductase [Paenibacillus sp.]